MGYELVAAVDLGSNSFRLQVGRVVDDQIYPLDSLKEPVRLAAGLTAQKILDGPSQLRALEALAEQAQGGDGPFLGGFVEVFVGGQAGSEPDRLLEGIQGIDLVVHHPPDLQAEAVGAQIDGGNQFIAHAAGSLFSGSCSVGEPSF